MGQQIILGLVRHALTIAGGYLVARGVDGATVEAIIGGLTAAAGLAWSVLEKRSR
jgi:hypothetical protein